MKPKPTYRAVSCERCNRRLEDCECEPGFPSMALDPRDVYGDDQKINSRKTGTIKWFSKEKGYGFIVPDGGGEETFVHYTAIIADGYRNLFENDRVTYDLVDVGKGPQAQNVRLLHAY